MTIRRGKSRNQEGYGRGVAAIAADDAVLLDEAALSERLLATFSADGYTPPTLPSVAVELLALSQRPDVEIAEVVRLLEQDGMLAGSVLKLVQSPVYASAAKLTSLRDVVMRCGLSVTRDLVLQEAMRLRVFRAHHYADVMECLRRHSMLTAGVSRAVSLYTPVEGEYAFLCGLLHDVGIAGILIALSEGMGPDAKLPDIATLWPAIDRVHEQAATQMAKLWDLPAELQMAVGAHHRVLIDGFVHPLSAIVCLANELAHSLGYGLIPDEKEGMDESDELALACLQSHHQVDRSSPKAVDQAREALEINEERAQLILRHARGILDDPIWSG